MKKLYLIFISTLFLFSCQNEVKDKNPANHGNKDGHDHSENENSEHVELTEKQFEALEIQLDTLSTKLLGKSIQVTGELTVPPAHEAKITAKIAGNIDDILVLEGDKVSKGQVIAYLSHPEIIEFQVKYLKFISQLDYLKSEYQRQKELYESDIKSGKEYQKIRADYLSTKAEVNGYNEKLELLHLDSDKIVNGKIYKRIPVKSPLSGYVFKISAKKGEYVNNDTEILRVVNNDHIHADVMVFEKDAKNVKIGQTVIFETDYNKGKNYEAEIYSVGKIFEKKPKAIHIHAEINSNKNELIPGAFVRGRIVTDSIPQKVIPEDAIFMKENKSYIFMFTEKHNSNYHLNQLKSE